MADQIRAISKRVYQGWSAGRFASYVVAEGPRKTIHLAGVGSNHPDDGAVRAPGDVAAQAALAFEHITSLLSAEHATLADVVKLTTYLTDESQLLDYSNAREKAFEGFPLPPHTLLIVKGLARPEMLVEIDIIATVPDHR